MPIAQKGKKTLWAPIFVGPSIATWDTSRQFSPSSTSAPITQYAPIWHEAGTFARALRIAVGWTLMEAESPSGGCMRGLADCGMAEDGLADYRCVERS